MTHLMSEKLAIVAVTLGVAAAAPAWAEDAQSILEDAREKQLERWEGVDSYLVRQSVMGHPVETRYHRAEVKDDAGKVQVLYLPVQGQVPQCGPMQMTPQALEAFSTASEMTGDPTSREIEEGMSQAGLPPELLSASGAEPGANALDTANQMTEFMERATLVGSESVEGRPAWHLRADGIDRVQAEGGHEYRMESVSLWLDKEEYVPLRTKIDGMMTSAGETKPMTIESVLSDYRRVPDSEMYESYKQVMTITGMLDAEQEAEMREAQQQMAEFEQQLAEMSEEQRQMMENMMGPQLDSMRAMAAGGGFRSDIAVESIVVNPPAAAGAATPCPTVAATTTAAAPAATASAAAPAPAAEAAPDPEALRAAQQACLQRKVEEAQKKKKTARGIGSLLSGVTRVAGRTGSDVGRDISETARDVYDVNATANDFARAAEDLGLTEDDVEECQNPGNVSK